MRRTSIPGVLKKTYRKAVATVVDVLDSKSSKSDQFTMEELHQFRVEVKKIKASLNLLHSIKNNFHRNRYFRPLKGLFAKAGKLRTVQVEKTLLKEYGRMNGIKNYLRSLTDQEQKNSARFHSAIRQGVVRKLKKYTAEVSKLMGDLHEEDIQKYFIRESRRLQRLLKKYGSDESKLHIVRKKLKSFFLNAKSIVSKERLENLDGLLNLLGEWHDRQTTFKQLIKVATVGKLVPAEFDRLNTIKTQLLAEKEKLFDEILTKIIFTSPPDFVGAGPTTQRNRDRVQPIEVPA